jgi:class 3 adenylate cyclase/tetratricopeptide (TPR) repeat protein
MEYRVLGSLEVLDGSGQRVPLGGTRQQTVLGSLLLRAGETVSLERLVDELWEQPPETAAKTVQVYVSRLRRLLTPGAIESRSGGYALRLDGDRLDLTQFERLAEEGRTALSGAEWERAASLLGEALSLWRGPALVGLTAEALRREAERLEEARLEALEDRVEADLARGRQREVVPELRALVAEHPFRERLCAQLMRGLYAAGRQAEALEVYRETRTRLDEELGLEPGAELRELERRMLSQDPELERVVETPPPAVPPRPEAAEPIRARRPATVLFADVVDSTTLGERLDPESVHRILERYSEAATGILERHGGTVEKFIGDAIVGFFGFAEVHEDDAQRAVRAAVELRDAVAELCEELRKTHGIELGIKIGVNSGDVFVGGGSGRETFATGDSVNVAARLEQHAGEGEILLGERTFRLVEDTVEAEPLEPLAVKGRKALVSAWRLLELSPTEPLSHRHQVPFVGREHQLEELRAAFARTRNARSCRLCTITGPAGIGKSRLAEEFVGEIGSSATVAVGRCLSYGEAVTYHALAEILQELVGPDPDHRIGQLIEDADEAALIARRVEAILGRANDTAPAEETFWAIRRLFEEFAAERPLVAILDDLHWGEPLLLDLLEYLAAFATAAPILVLCLARRELFETRPSWATGEVVALVPLAEPEARELVHAIGEGDVDQPEEDRIVRAAEGNPLFLEQLVATRTECGAEHLPPNVQALLTARVARLDSGERAVLEHASVEGRNFRWSIVAALLPDDARESLGHDLMSLVRRQLIEPDPSVFAGEDSFRFSHVLIREAVYEGLPKEVCADLHERLAAALRDGPGSEDEVVGHHLEQAVRCRALVGLSGEHELELAREAQTRLDAAARKLLLGGDASGASDLLERAVSLPADDASRLELMPSLGAALLDAGRLTEADRVLSEAVELASGDELLASRARVEQQLVRLQAEAHTLDEARGVVDAALRVFEEHRDELGLCRGWYLRGVIAFVAGQVATADEAWQRASESAVRAHNQRDVLELPVWRATAAFVGPMPVARAIGYCNDLGEQVKASPLAVAGVLHPLAAVHAMQGDFDVARSLVSQANGVLDEFDLMFATAGSTQFEACVEMLSGRPEAAEEVLRRGYERMEQAGEKALLATIAAMLAQAIYPQGRYDEAQAYCDVSRGTAARDDLSVQIVSRGVQATILARQERLTEATALADEAVRLAAGTDFLNYHGDALVDLAEVLHVGERPTEAAEQLSAALRLYERKGNRSAVDRARRRLGVLTEM